MPPHPRPKPSASSERAPILPAPVEEENIDINVSDTSEVGNKDTPAPGKAQATPANAPGNEVTPTHVNPIVKMIAKSSNRALDIDLFFDRGKGKQSACKYCK
jgi:hypothetical protein